MMISGLISTASALLLGGMPLLFYTVSGGIAFFGMQLLTGRQITRQLYIRAALPLLIGMSADVLWQVVRIVVTVQEGLAWITRFSFAATILCLLFCKQVVRKTGGIIVVCFAMLCSIAVIFSRHIAEPIACALTAVWLGIACGAVIQNSALPKKGNAE